MKMYIQEEGLGGMDCIHLAQVADVCKCGRINF